MDKPTFGTFSSTFPRSAAVLGRPGFRVAFWFSSPPGFVAFSDSWLSEALTTAETSFDDAHPKGWTLDGEAV